MHTDEHIDEHAHAISRERLEAARILWVQSRSSREAATGVGRHLANPENREQAAEAYREAKRRLYAPEHGGLGDVRYQVHDAARVLGLSTDDLRG